MPQVLAGLGTGQPIVTDEGYSPYKIGNTGLRGLAKKNGVQVFTPRGFLEGRGVDSRELRSMTDQFCARYESSKSAFAHLHTHRKHQWELQAVVDSVYRYINYILNIELE